MGVLNRKVFSEKPLESCVGCKPIRNISCQTLGAIHLRGNQKSLFFIVQRIIPTVYCCLILPSCSPFIDSIPDVSHSHLQRVEVILVQIHLAWISPSDFLHLGRHIRQSPLTKCGRLFIFALSDSSGYSEIAQHKSMRLYTVQDVIWLDILVNQVVAMHHPHTVEKPFPNFFF